MLSSAMTYTVTPQPGGMRRHCTSYAVSAS
ncbi:hypothetical protein Deiofobo_0372 [Pseudomonas phage Deifobo]|nr:hypothetical protein Deiofobo_0372 [Pseudomonas phage Deifobo]